MVAAGGSYAMRIRAVYDEALFIFINPDLRIVPADGSDIQVTVTIEVDRLGAIVMVNSVLVPFVDHVLFPHCPNVDVLKEHHPVLLFASVLTDDHIRVAVTIKVCSVHAETLARDHYQQLN
jgi:hypothetical protein